MIWLTWRQFRVQALVVFGFVAALAVVLAVTGSGLANLYDTGIAACTARDTCSEFTTDFFRSHEAVYFGLITLTMVVPGVIGLFWGAPLVTRELETGTHRLVWNQSITRTRWLAVKLGVTALAAMAAAGFVSLAVSWWSSPLDAAAGPELPRLSPLLFAARDIAPVGHAAFAFVLGVMVGMLIRRTLPAMALTIVAFVAVQIAVPLLVRPYVVAPVQLAAEITEENLVGLGISGSSGEATRLDVNVQQPGAWIISSHTVDAAGTPVAGVPAAVEMDSCMVPPGARNPDTAAQQACFARLHSLGYRQQISYHPGGRYWPFQWLETATFLAIAFGMSWFSFWWLRRRLT